MPELDLLPGAINISGILRPGVYILHHHSRVVYIGKARCLLAAICNHRLALTSATLARLFPHRRIPFDGIEIIPCAADRAIPLAAALITLHQPRYNLHPPRPLPTPVGLDRPPSPPTPPHETHP